MKLIRKNKILLAIVIVLMLSVFSMIPQMAIANDGCSAGDESGSGVLPSQQDGNPTCSEINHCGEHETKIEPVASGTYPLQDVTGHSVTIDVDGAYFDWTSTLGICAVIVKGGTCGVNVYQYGSLSYGDTNLHTPINPSGEPAGLSHIIFCYPESVCPPPDCEITGDTEICEGEETTLCASDIAGASYSWTGPGFTSDKKCITVGVAGKYEVTITDECGKSTCSVDLTVNTLPDCSITGDTEICEGETTELCASDIAGASYSWTGPGFTSDKKCITVGVAGKYEVTIKNECGESSCSVKLIVYPKPTCIIASVDPICAGESVQLYAAVNGGTPGYTYSWGDNVGGTFNNSSIEDSIWNSPSGFTGIATLTLTVTDSKGCTTTCSVKVTVDPCERRPCKCSLVVQKRDEAGNPIDGAVFVVDGIEKTTRGGEARWDNLECDTTYEVKELKPEERTKGIHLGDCGERSTMRVVNKIVVEEEGEEGELVVAGIMEVLPFTGPAIPYSPFIGISTVLAGTFLYILSKSKKKR